MAKRSISSVYTGDDRLQEHSGIKRNKKACTECRQQKVRCNATVDSDDPCSRCRRMGLECRISDPFKREHKRQRLSELEQEARELRERLESQATQSWTNQVPTPTLSMENGNPVVSPVIDYMQQHKSPPPGHQVNPIMSPPSDTIDSKPPPITPASALGTASRTIEGNTLAGVTIDEIFEIYWRDFHQLLPVLDSSLAPNEYYRRSPLLFWAIIVVAGRIYDKDPSICENISENVLDMALLSLGRVTVPTIKGYLLLLTWPAAKTVNIHDTSYSLAGSVIHMAMQIGLHIPTSSQDFSRVKVNLTDFQIKRRAELWGYCLLTYQRCCSFKGHSPLALLETYQDSEQRQALFDRVGPSLKFQLKLNGVITRTSSALLQNGLRVMTRDQENSMDVLIRVFEANMRDIEPDAASELDKFYLYTARLTIQMFYFYKDTSKKLPTFMLTRLYSSACNLLRHVDTADKSGAIKLAAGSTYFFYAISISVITILRLLKAPSTAQYLDESSHEMFELGTDILKRLSVWSNDAPARIQRAMLQLWDSSKAFRNPDGTEHMALRIRTRLAMSPVYDCVWWWREEFGGQPGAYTMTSDSNVLEQQGALPPQEGLSTHLPNGPSVFSAMNNNGGASVSDPTAAQNGSMSGNINDQQQLQDMSSFLDDHLLAELGWTNSNAFFFPGVGETAAQGAGQTFPADWYSPTDVNGFAL